jgi:diguanylate cyclase (GGDEF)-like protein
MIWFGFYYCFHALFIPTILDFAGGLFAAVTVNLYHLCWFLYENYLRMAELVNAELSLHVGVAIVTFFCAVGVGLLSENLTEKQMQLQNLNRKLNELAMYDSLTDLPNRHYFMEKLSEALQYEESVSLMFIDLDGFKRVNDTFGHETGDHLLKEVAAQLNRFVNDSTFASRLGGDEFIVIIEEMDKKELMELAVDILRVLQLKVDDLMISVSIGIAFSSQGDTPSSLLKRADTAMYQVKLTGKNAVGE